MFGKDVCKSTIYIQNIINKNALHKNVSDNKFKATFGVKVIVKLPF